ncbi:peptidase S41 [Longimonas halophila]|uniref:Peptidase S41 n=1 Tax=Longimonas halophila TaxID=1469170 RepID=A0A2H3P417_9BACT|nr:S41 family peptidase [Longimonas halophila]PEN05092.1 peptidase S41 [Longimonas halophila]
MIERSTSTRFLTFVCTCALLAGSLALLGMQSPADTAPDAPRASADSSGAIANVEAFARLYGYVRFFHPSDAAAELDWDRFVVHGVRHVYDAPTPDVLRERLHTLFAPIAPTVQLYEAGATPPNPPDMLTPPDTAGLRLVAWQHRGIGLGNPGSYKSVRLNRALESDDGPQFGIGMRSIGATTHRGKQIRLRADVRADVDGSANQARLLLGVDRRNQQRGFFDNMGDRPITASSWNTYTITGPVADDATHITIGGILVGEGEAWFDNVQLHVRSHPDSAWTPVPLLNAGFEAGDTGEMPPNWGNRSDYEVTTVDERSVQGDQAMHIASPPPASVAEPLFDARPDAGAVINKLIGRGLAVQMPLALYSRDEQTLRPGDAPAPARLNTLLANGASDAALSSDRATHMAAVVMAWNVMQHFYPYFDVVDTDWEGMLPRTLRAMRDADTPLARLRVMQRMVAELDDGHGRVFHPLVQNRAGLPLRVDWIDEQVVVAAVSDSLQEAETPCIRPGDVITAVDGTPSADVISTRKTYISGSPQWTEHRALSGFARGPRGTEVTLSVQRIDDGSTTTCTVPRNTDRPVQQPRPDGIEEIDPGVYYVDLTRVGPSAVQQQMDQLAAARGVVFDMRGYPETGNQQVLRHLTSDTLQSPRWQVPQLIYPDQERRVGYDTSGRWQLTPQTPTIGGAVAFLTDAEAISFAESILGIVEHYELGAIIGGPTAGANGNVNPFSLPGNYRIRWTGMRVLKHDRSQHHRIGIQPTIPIQPTRQSVAEGRDRYLEAALQHINTNAPPN